MIIRTIRDDINEICFLSNLPVPPDALDILYFRTEPMVQIVREIKTTIEEYDDQ